MPNQDSAPASLDKQTLAAPETRMKDALSTQGFFRQLVNNDCERSYKRARVNGLIDGRPPYKASKLREAGRADAANVNWGRARSYMESGSGNFYDLFSEAPTYITVISSYGTDEQRQTYSDIISGCADEVLRESTVWDYEMQVSIDNMVLHGCGPLMFEDSNRCLPKAFLCGDLKVPEFSKSDVSYWDSGGVQATYYPPELYEFIKNEEFAKAIGWDVEFTKKVIANAMGVRTEAGILYEWEFYQAELKNNTLNYYDDSLIIRLAHVFWKEFDGRITHAIVERDSASGMETRYLYLNVGRYSKFSNVVHPMYFDHGNGGYHHSVTGLGVKMYGPMEYENRLICNLCDKAFAPKMLFKPGSAEASQRITMARYGDYAVLPKGVETLQVPVQGLMSDSIEFFEVIQGINGDTLSSYKAGVQPQTSGNPPTKFQKMLEAAAQSSLSKTQINRYYKQLDMLYAEIYRRLSNLNSTCDMAKSFQQKCEKQGVPREAISRIANIQATRVAGQGTGFMRKMAIDALFQIAPGLPEDGRSNLIKDKIAAEAGQHAVARYYPVKAAPMASDQEVNALTEVGKMKQGIPSKPSSSQNPVIFATVFVQTGVQALQSLQKGGDAHDVLRFLTLDGPAIGAQLKRFANDPTRKAIHDQLSQQYNSIAKAVQKLKQQLVQQAQQQQAQQQKQQQTMSDTQLKAAKLKADIALKNQKQQAMLRQREETHRQKMALADASTAHEMSLNRIKALQE
jgi:hypothetical protein